LAEALAITFRFAVDRLAVLFAAGFLAVVLRLPVAFFAVVFAAGFLVVLLDLATERFALDFFAVAFLAPYLRAVDVRADVFFAATNPLLRHRLADYG